mgnify:CR=1 FL=1
MRSKQPDAPNSAASIVDAGTTKLGIGDLMRSSALCLWRGGWPVAVCLALWAAVAGVYAVLLESYRPAARLVAAGFEWLGLDAQTQFESSFRVENFVLGLLDDLVGCVFVASLLRIILIGGAGIRGAGFGRAAGGVLLVGLATTAATGALFLGPEALGEIFGFALGFGPIRAGITLLFSVMLLYLMARLSLVYPSVATGRGWALATNWRCTRGNGVRIAVVLAAVLAVVVVADLLMEATIFRVPYAPDGDYDFESMVRTQWGIVAKDVARSLLITAAPLVVSAVAFARLAGFPAAHVPGAARTPTQTAEVFE